MVNLVDRSLAARWMPVMLIGGLVATLAAALFLFLGGRSQQQDQDYRAHVAELTVIAGAMPAQAAAAGRGEAAAFTRLDESTQRLERVLADIDSGQAAFASLSSESARRLGGDSGWSALLDSAKRVLAARESAGALKASAAEARAAIGRVLATTGDAVSAPGGAVALRVLPRFETVAQRTTDDLASLADGAGDPAVITQRITENTALLSQFLAGLAGLDRSAGVPPVTGQAAGRLTEVREAFAAYEKQLQGTLEHAGALAGAERAAAEVAAAAGNVSAALELPAAAGGSDRYRWALIAIAIAAVAFAGALFGWISAAGTRRIASLESERNRRNQDAI